MTQSASTLRRRIALVALAATAALTGLAHAEQQPVVGSKYDVALRLNMFGEVTSPRIVTYPGDRFALAGEHGGKPWRMEFTINRSGARESVRVDGKISSGDQTLAAPVLVGSLGQRLAVRTSDGVDVAMIIKEVAR